MHGLEIFLFGEVLLLQAFTSFILGNAFVQLLLQLLVLSLQLGKLLLELGFFFLVEILETAVMVIS